ncbi:MAG TPA: wax ester/triacylglycerol synthase family O-acyltransferase [Streptosporangiaceae bacterium]
MSTLDAGFYFVEHENVPMHIGSLAVFEGPAPAYPDLLALYAAKLPGEPRYRQVVRSMPLQALRPFWADDQHFELTYHVRHAGVPPPGGTAELREMAARVLAQRLDRARPLWEAWFLEGLAGGRWAILSKVHHCMVDGVGGSDLLAALFDLSPEPPDLPEPPPWRPRPGPPLVEVLAGGALDMLTWPVHEAAELPGLVRTRLPGPAAMLRFGRGLAGSARRLAAPAASSLNGPISPHRRWRWARLNLDEVKEVKRARGVTVNDVVLAAITAGFRDLLAVRGELADGVVVRSLVPVSLRGADEHELVSNKISAVLANLPAGQADPLARLSGLHRQMENLKRTGQAAGAEMLTGLLGLAAPSLLALGTRSAFRLPQPLVQTVTTNVPGPQIPLYLLGRKLAELYPYVPIGDNVRIGIAIFSYTGEVTFGITADYSTVAESELDVLVEGIGAGLAELLALVRPPRKGRKAGKPAQRPAYRRRAAGSR